MIYERLTLDDGRRFIVKVTRENDRFLYGIEVNKEGDEIFSDGRRTPRFDQRLHLIEKIRITKRVEMVMDNQYAILKVKE